MMPSTAQHTLPLLCSLLLPHTLPASAQPSSSGSVAQSASPVTTTAPPSGAASPGHWTPDRPDPYVCEYLGQNECWTPQFGDETGAPYSGWTEPRPPHPLTCVVKPCNDPAQDDAPAVVEAFERCRENAHIIFENTTYHVASVMNTTGLKNVDVEIRGTLAWNNSDINYWRSKLSRLGGQEFFLGLGLRSQGGCPEPSCSLGLAGPLTDAPRQLPSRRIPEPDVCVALWRRSGKPAPLIHLYSYLTQIRYTSSAMDTARSTEMAKSGTTTTTAPPTSTAGRTQSPSPIQPTPSSKAFASGAVRCGPCKCSVIVHSPARGSFQPQSAAVSFAAS